MSPSGYVRPKLQAAAQRSGLLRIASEDYVVKRCNKTEVVVGCRYWGRSRRRALDIDIGTALMVVPRCIGGASSLTACTPSGYLAWPVNLWLESHMMTYDEP